MGANLNKSNLENSDLRYSDLRFANLSFSNLCGADLRNAHLDYINLMGALYNSYTKGLTDEQKEIMIEKRGPIRTNYGNEGTGEIHSINKNYEDLRWANFNTKDLSRANLKNINLNSLVLYGGNVDFSWNNWDENFKQGILYTNLMNVNLENASLNNAKLNGVNFYNANLQNIDLSDATLRYANLCNANLTGFIFNEKTNFQRAWYNDNTKGLDKLSFEQKMSMNFKYDFKF